VWDLSDPQTFWDLLHARTQYENQQPNFEWYIKLDVRKVLHGWPRMLTRDLFAVANLVNYLTKEYIGALSN